MTRPTPPSTARDHRRAIVKLLRDLAHRHQLWDVFGDFVEACALSLANAADLTQREPREARYLRIVARYTPAEFAAFPQALAHLVEALELEPGDVLGSIFGELELGNAARGQFFTPYELCRLMAATTLGSREEFDRVAGDRGFVTVSEPACGAGAQVVALAMHLKDLGLNYQRAMHVTAVDVDARAVHMAFVQLALLHVPAVVVLGNTLTLEEREHWYTPAHVLGGWSWRLRARAHAAPAPVDPAALVVPAEPAQLDLCL